MRVVPALDELEHLPARLGLGAEAVASEELALQRGEKALAQRVVIAVPHRPHGGPNAGLPAAPSEGDRGVLRALVGVADDGPGPALPEGHDHALEEALKAGPDDRGKYWKNH